MKKRFSKLMAIVMVFALIVAFAAIPASAATNYTAINGGTTSFNKYFIVDEDAEVPALTFTYNIAPGTAKPAENDNTKMEVYAGVGEPTVSNVAFSAADTASKRNTVADGETVTLDPGENYVMKTSTINFATVSFPEPGIYRYVLTENVIANVTDVSYDTQKGNGATDRTRYLDVYVTDNNGTLAVSSYVLHNTESNPTVDQVTNNNDRVDDKSDGFVNEYKTANLEFGKEVTGNQGSKDKYFKFTLNIANALPSTVYNVDITGAEATVANNTATKTGYIGATNAATITTNESGTATAVYYLHDGQYVKVKGLPQGATYTLIEDKEDYTQTPGITTEVSGKEQVYTAPASTAAAIGANDVYVGFTNNKEGVIPTGVLLTVAPFAIGLLLFGALAIFFVARKKKRAEEE